MTFDILILYAKSDYELAIKVAEFLTNCGINVWHTDDSTPYIHLKASDRLQAIADSCASVLIYTPRSNTDIMLESDIDMVFAAGKVCIPFCTTDEPMTMVLRYYLGKSQHVMAQTDLSHGISDLLDAVRANVPRLAEEQQAALAEQALFSTLSGYTISEASNIVRDKQTDEETRQRVFDEMLQTFIDKELKDDISADESVDKSNAYDLLVNAAGELLLIIQVRKTYPNNPYCIFSGDGSIIFVRSPEEMMLISIDQSDDSRSQTEKIRAQRDILVCEIENDDVAYEYNVRLFHDFSAITTT